MKMSLLRLTFVDLEPRKEPLLLAEARQDGVVPEGKPSMQKLVAKKIEKIRELADINQMRLQFV